MPRLRLLPAMLALLLAGCASQPSAPYDRLEPYNRAMFKFNDTLDRSVVKPVAEGYVKVVPSPVRTGVGNFFDNLKDVYSAAFNTLRWEPEKALNDVMRVVMNSTFGLAGLIDIATPAGLKNNKTSLGDTLAAWGWHSSDYFVVPFFGPSTVRDGTSLGVSLFGPGPEKMFYDTKWEMVGFYGVYGVSQRARYLGVENVLSAAALDPYTYTRDVYMQLRARQLGLPDPTQPADDNLNLDELLDTPGGDASAPKAGKPPAASAAL